MLDPRSGTYESPYRPEDVRVPAASLDGMRALAAAGYPLVLASNQPAAAKATVGLVALQAVHGRLVEILDAAGIVLAGARYCHHHPRGIVAALSGPCACRQPEPGLILAAAAELGLEPARSWMVGDSDTDIEAGRRAGCRTILVENPASAPRRQGGSRPDGVAADLAVAAALIILSSS